MIVVMVIRHGCGFDGEDENGTVLYKPVLSVCMIRFNSYRESELTHGQCSLSSTVVCVRADSDPSALNSNKPSRPQPWNGATKAEPPCDKFSATIFLGYCYSYL